MEDLKKLFNDEIHWTTSYGEKHSYREADKADNEPTNIQAEILFEEIIPPEYIKKIIRINDDVEYDDVEYDDVELPF
ncbi:DarT ssDNA thymidine ADP-ribosyltransferase family protein [Campylobacter armoricus]|uniref:DarT ssDNA thymidine ADP-ribosyltransferase family protein n=1 Tax=Campylobacter armoricus TaxID=2505970 RepID=UPI001F1C5BE0|nr:DarT ssDNA thymidine ADP-ribosyltransferase family protein [Campylobacter armoricus]